jgi:hypothetical protein
LEAAGADKAEIEFVPQLPDVFPVFDSLQMRLTSISPEAVQGMIKAMNGKGHKLQLFADKFNARYYRSWRYCVDDTEKFVGTDNVLDGVVDMRSPLSSFFYLRDGTVSG